LLDAVSVILQREQAPEDEGAVPGPGMALVALALLTMVVVTTALRRR